MSSLCNCPLADLEPPRAFGSHMEFDPRLIEQALFVAGRTDPLLEHAIHGRTDRLFDIDDPGEREAAFRMVYADLFERAGFGSRLHRLIDEQPLIVRGVERCVVREAISVRRERAELFVKAADDGSTHTAHRAVARAGDTAPRRTLLIQLRAESLVHLDESAAWLRRELLHVADMLDPRFGYDPQSLVGDSPQQNLIRDRYRVLWDCYVEVRLSRRGHRHAEFEEALQRNLRSVFRTPDANAARVLFQAIFDSAPLSHAQLFQWASKPETLPADHVS